jgi:hypothetical protein
MILLFGGSTIEYFIDFKIYVKDVKILLIRKLKSSVDSE